MNKREMNIFIDNIVKEVEDNNAAVFAGAGLSKSAGFVDWKSLMKDIAEDLHLDIDKETDFIQLAQYYCNEHGRHGLNQILVDEFYKNLEITKNHKLLSKMPISTYWTTNYDDLLEKSLRKEGNKLNIVKSPDDFKVRPRKTNIDLYKMHGDKDNINEIILTKDDYDKYDYTENRLFREKLVGDLISKTFIFIGFSFNDPNIDYILSRIKFFIGDDTRSHYCFMKKVSIEDYKLICGNYDKEEFLYDETKQSLKIKDLKRHNIKVLLVKEYEDITKILEKIYIRVKSKNVFISGSSSVNCSSKTKSTLEFSKKLSSSLIDGGFNIVTGFGLGIGDSIVSGALEKLLEKNEFDTISNRLYLRPFPQNIEDKNKRKKVWTKYRQDILRKSGVAIFIFGNKKNSEGKKVLADGMIEEFEIAIENEIIPIPVGATGDTSKELWERTMNNFNRYVGKTSLKPYYEKLGDNSKSDEELVDIVMNICKEITNTRL